MEQEHKSLLLKDLSSRLPYEVKIKTSYDGIKEPIRLLSINPNKGTFTIGSKFTTISGLEFELYDCKPYLYPLSSMTEEQEIEYNNLHNIVFSCYEDGLSEAIAKLQDFYNKNHIDYRGLIPMNLAKDATGLGIY